MKANNTASTGSYTLVVVCVMSMQIVAPVLSGDPYRSDGAAQYAINHDLACDATYSNWQYFQSKDQAEEFLVGPPAACRARVYELAAIPPDEIRTLDDSSNRRKSFVVVQPGQFNRDQSQRRILTGEVVAKLHAEVPADVREIVVYSMTQASARMITVDATGSELRREQIRQTPCAQVCAPVWKAADLPMFPLGHSICLGDVCACFGAAPPLREEAVCRRRLVALIEPITASTVSD